MKTADGSAAIGGLTPGLALVGAGCHCHHAGGAGGLMTNKIAKHLRTLDDQQKAKLMAVRDEMVAGFKAESQAENKAIMEAAIAQVQSDR